MSFRHAGAATRHCLRLVTLFAPFALLAGLRSTVSPPTRYALRPGAARRVERARGNRVVLRGAVKRPGKCHATYGNRATPGTRVL